MISRKSHFDYMPMRLHSSGEAYSSAFSQILTSTLAILRHLSFTGRNDGPIEEYISFVCQILSCFPKLHRVKLDISAQISFSPRVLQLVRDRIELAEVSIPKLTLNPHNGEQDWLVMQPLASVLREKVRVLTAEYWVWSEHWQNEFSSWRLVEDWGLSVHKLIVRTDQRAQINLSQWWSQITWRGLQEIITDQPFLHGSDETPGSFREFLTRHPTLLSIDTLLRLGSDDQRWHSESFNLAPVLRACSQSGFHPQFAKFGRSTGVTPFEFQCKNLVIIPPTDLTAQRSLELLSKSCPNMQFLALNFHRCPVNMIQIRDYAVSTVEYCQGYHQTDCILQCSSLRRLFQDVVFHNSLIEVCISWYTADVDVDESDDLPPWQSSVTAFGVAMSEISLEIAKASPSITLIHHFIFSKGLFVPTASWPFAANKSQDGAIHLRQESRHEGQTREWMRLV